MSDFKNIISEQTSKLTVSNTLYNFTVNMVIDTNSNLDLTPYVVNISLPEFSIEMDTVSIP